jgi:hypothetical protein
LIFRQVLECGAAALLLDYLTTTPQEGPRFADRLVGPDAVVPLFSMVFLQQVPSGALFRTAGASARHTSCSISAYLRDLRADKTRHVSLTDFLGPDVRPWPEGPTLMHPW